MTTLKEIDVEAVVGDIATHIKNQFEGILARVSKDKLTLQENVNMILNLPIVKGLLEEKKALIKQLENLQEENKELKLQLVEYNIVRDSTNEKQGIFLEVKEIPSDASSVTQEEIQEHIKEEEKKQLASLHNEMMNRYSFWSQKLESPSQFNSSTESNQIKKTQSTFTLLQSDDSMVHTSEDEDSDDNESPEDDDDDDDDDEDEDEDEDDNKEDKKEEEEEEEEEEEDEELSPQEEQLKFLTGCNKKEVEKDMPEEEEIDVEEIELEGKKYYTTDKDNGIIYEYLEDGEIGEEIGRLEEGKLFLS